MANLITCSNAFMNDNALELLVMFIISVVFLLAISAVKRRKRFHREVCHARPGPIVPLNMLGDFRNRFGYALAFGVIASHCIIFLLNNRDTVFIFGTRIGSSFKKSPPYAKVFVTPVVTVYIGLITYPIFYCLRTKHRVLGSVSGAIYCCIWLALSISKFVTYKGCAGEASSKNLSKYFDAFVSSYLPQFICLALLLFKFIMDLFKAIMYLPDLSCARKNASFAVARSVQQGNCNWGGIVLNLGFFWITKYLHKIYKPDPDFRYSCQIISSFVVSAVAVYTVTLLLFGRFAFLGITDGLSYIAVIFAAIQSLIICFQLFALYRQHVMKLRKGDRSWILVPKDRQSPVTFMSASMKYAGLQVGYLVAGFFINYILAIIVVVVIKLINAHPKILLKLLDHYWPIVLYLCVAYFGQYLAARFIFLQDKGDLLAIENRKAYHITAYFLFFYNVFIGLVSGSLRLLKVIVLGTLFLTRIQKPILPADLIRCDTGYLAYIGYVLVEHYHSNPILNVFVNLINPEKDSESKILGTPQFTTLEEQPESENRFPETAAFRLARNRWHLAVMLMRNPSLTRYRKQHNYNHEEELINKHDEELVRDIV